MSKLWYGCGVAYESLPGAIQFAAYAAIRSRTANRMPYPDIWNHPRPFTCFSMFPGYRITHAAYAYRVYGIQALDVPGGL